MLLELKIKNFLSFKNEIVFSLVADSKKNLDENFLKFDNDIEQINILKSSVIFWANASWKSNIFKIMLLLKSFIVKSFNIDKEKLPFECFKLNNYSNNEPIFIWINFIIDNVRYEYSFSILNNEIFTEELYHFKKWRKKYLFKREQQNLDVDYTLFDIAWKSVEKNKSLRKNALFLTTVSIFNWEISQKIKNYFSNNIHVISWLEPDSKYLENYELYIKDRLKDDKTFKTKVENFIKVADFWIEWINIKDIKLDENKIPEKIKKFIEITWEDFKLDSKEIETIHKIFNQKWQEIWITNFTLDDEESEWTRQFMHLLWPIIDTLEKGTVLFIDEMTSKLHPYISKFIVWLFNSDFYNKNWAQLVFNSHDTNLLDQDLFRRDQIYFAEKNKLWESEIFSLNDFAERTDSNIEKKYLMWNFGAIPFIDNSKQLW